MRNLILGILVAFAGFAGKAQEKNKNAHYTIEVNGVCDDCQKRIQKSAFKINGVKSAVWDADSHQLSLILNEEKCSLLDVKKAVAKAGYDSDEVKASEEAYNNLPHCCQYDRK
jgi:mercuric ion binding protein